MMPARARSDGPRVLIVDDVPANAQPLAVIVGMAGATTVRVATDVASALRCCPELGPDLVVLNGDMEDVDAQGVLTALRIAEPEEWSLPVILVTADPSSEARQRAFDAGANDVVTTPYDQVEVLRRVMILLSMRGLYQRVSQHNLQAQEFDAHA